MNRNQSLLNLKNIQPKVLGQSQKGQDSFIEYIFNVIGVTNKYYVEFGAADGVLHCNTWYLRTQKNWSGLLLDCGWENKEINLHKRKIEKDNVLLIFKEFEVPEEFDFLCVDMDGMDFYMVEQILTKYKPRVIMAETNVRFRPDESYVINYDPNWVWDGRKWYGVSPFAYKKLVNKFDYTPIYLHIDDMFIIRNDCLIDEEININWLDVFPESNEILYRDHVGSFRIPVTYFDKDEWLAY